MTAPSRRANTVSTSFTETANDYWRSSRTAQHLRSLSKKLYEIGVELNGFGPYAEHQVATQSGEGVECRLSAINSDLGALLYELYALRNQYIDTQLRSLGITTESVDLKLHIGGGAAQLPGWINVGAYPMQLAMSATWDLPFGEASADRVLVSRIPATMSLPIETRRFLSEIHRVLAPKGSLQIYVGDVLPHSRAKPQSLEQAYREWADTKSRRTQFDEVLANLGADVSRSLSKSGTGFGSQLSALIYLLIDERFSDVRYTTCPSGLPATLDLQDGAAVLHRLNWSAQFRIDASKPYR